MIIAVKHLTKASLLGLALASMVAVSAQAQKRQELARTPPMGWNSWNYFDKKGINEQIVHEVIDAMVAQGLRDAGYNYVVVDGGWRGTNLGPNQELLVHPVRFPHGMKPLADYAHSKGLKFGVHTVPGTHDCGGDPVGALNHEEVHIKQFVDWGFDFVKVDKCKCEGGWPEDLVKAAYFKWSDLLAHSGRDITFSISAYKYRDWYPEVCNMARTTGDIACRVTPTHAASFEQDGRYHSVMAIALENDKAAAFAGNGYWNDPDMMVTGDHGLTPEEQKSHFALWCVMTAPLMLGDDPRHLTPEEKDLILNKECIAIDQDPTEQGRRIKADGDGEIWAKKLSNGGMAVLLLNRNGAVSKAVAFSAKDIGLTGKLSAKDVYGRKDLGTLQATFSRDLPPHGCVLLLVSATPAKSSS
jgi:alpha-galactosidase